MSTATQASPPASRAFSTPQARKRLLGGAVGTFVEWYDFLIYAVTAPVFASLFFDPTNPTAALLGTFAIFGVGFIARPLGGIFFGYLGDKFGRIKIMMITILMMGAATGVIGILPTYATIGIIAPLLLLLARVFQGFSAGGEHSGALSFVVESAPHGRRGYWIGIIFAVSVVPSLFLGFGLIALRGVIGEDAYLSWGWRLPFFLGAILAVVGLWIRMKLSDPEEFVQAKKEDAVRNPLKTAIVEEWPALLRVLFLLAPHLVSYYLAITYLYTHMVTTLSMNPSDALLANTLGCLFIVIAVPVLGRLGDRIGRKPLMWFGTIWIILAAYPSMLLTDTGTLWGATSGTLLMVVGTSAYVSGGIVTMLELFRTTSRQSGHGLSYSLGTVVFGGLTPLIASAVVASFGPIAPAIMPVIAGVIGVIALSFTPETRDVNLTTAEVEDAQTVDAK